MVRPMATSVRFVWYVFFSVSLFLTTLIPFSVPTNSRDTFDCPLPHARYYDCTTDPMSEWTGPEKWAWQQICSARTADFNRRTGNEVLDPRDPTHVATFSDGHRTLSNSFLRTIISKEPFLNKITDLGIRICGAYFEDALNLNHAVIPGTWGSQRSPGDLVISESLFDKSVHMRALSAESISLANSQLNERVDLAEARVFQTLKLEGATLGNVIMTKLNEFEDDLPSVNLRDSTVLGAVVMREARIKNLYVQGATLQHADLTGTEIADTLSIGNLCPTFPSSCENNEDRNMNWEGNEDGPYLILEDVRVRIFLTSPDAWPEDLNLELDGFEYDQNSMTQDDTDGFFDAISLLHWLETDGTYSQQPYLQLADHLDKAGKEYMARIISHANQLRSSETNDISFGSHFCTTI